MQKDQDRSGQKDVDKSQQQSQAQADELSGGTTRTSTQQHNEDVSSGKAPEDWGKKREGEKGSTETASQMSQKAEESGRKESKDSGNKGKSL